MYVPPWEYSCPSNLESSCTLLSIGSLVGRDTGPSNCGIIKISWALIAGELLVSVSVTVGVAEVTGILKFIVFPSEVTADVSTGSSDVVA